jgi:hypothetical protein
VLVAARQLPRQREEPLDELVARGLVAVAVHAHEQAAILAGARRPLSEAIATRGICSAYGARIRLPVDALHAPVPDSQRYLHRGCGAQ